MLGCTEGEALTTSLAGGFARLIMLRACLSIPCNVVGVQLVAMTPLPKDVRVSTAKKGTSKRASAARRPRTCSK